MEYKIILGIIAVAIGIFSYIPYFRNIYFGTTRPHIFSWLAWGLLEGTAFFAQVSKGGGAGAWVTGVTAVSCLAVFISALSRGEKVITRVDKLSFAGVLIGILLWLVTENPLSAVVIVSVTDFLGFVPTFRKSYSKPYEETVVLYTLSIVKLIISLFALEAINPTTFIYPASLVLTNTTFVIMILVRRRMIPNKLNTI